MQDYVPAKMARQRKISWKDVGAPMKELCLKHNIDPGEEMIRMTKETITKDGVTMPLFVHLMGPRDGYKVLVDIYKFLSNCIRPVLRSTEVHGDNQNLLNITINQFGPLASPQPTTIDVPVVKKEIQDAKDQEPDNPSP